MGRWNPFLAKRRVGLGSLEPMWMIAFNLENISTFPLDSSHLACCFCCADQEPLHCDLLWGIISGFIEKEWMWDFVCEWVYKKSHTLRGLFIFHWHLKWEVQIPRQYFNSVFHYLGAFQWPSLVSWKELFRIVTLWCHFTLFCASTNNTYMWVSTGWLLPVKVPKDSSLFVLLLTVFIKLDTVFLAFVENQWSLT